MGHDSEPTPAPPPSEEESIAITDRDRWQHLVFAVYANDAADYVPDGVSEREYELYRVLDVADSLFPEVDPERDWGGYAMHRFVRFLRDHMMSEPSPQE